MALAGVPLSICLHVNTTLTLTYRPPFHQISLRFCVTALPPFRSVCAVPSELVIDNYLLRIGWLVGWLVHQPCLPRTVGANQQTKLSSPKVGGTVTKSDNTLDTGPAGRVSGPERESIGRVVRYAV